jgi:hypothetical protein
MNMSQLDLIVIDNFYDDPMSMREIGLDRDYRLPGNYPGHRTGRCPEDECDLFRTKLEENLRFKVLDPIAVGETTVKGEDDEKFLRWHFSTTKDVTWIHHDVWGEFTHPIWACMVYMTPDAPASAGTGIYRHKETGIYQYDAGVEETDFNTSGILLNENIDLWEPIAFVGNVFNRFVTYPGNLYHRNISSFGNNKYDGRLTQLGFFCRGPNL